MLSPIKYLNSQMISLIAQGIKTTGDNIYLGMQLLTSTGILRVILIRRWLDLNSYTFILI